MSQLYKHVKDKTGMTGNQIAKEIGESAELISRWNLGKSAPNGINTLKLMKLGDLNTDEAMKLIEKGNVSLAVLFTIGFTSALLFATSVYGFETASAKGFGLQVLDSKYTLCEIKDG